MPAGQHPEDRSTTGCPLREVDAGLWSLLDLWHSWNTVGGTPFGGSVVEQPARLISALQVVGGEVKMLEGYYQEQAEKTRAK